MVIIFKPGTGNIKSLSIDLNIQAYRQRCISAFRSLDFAVPGRDGLNISGYALALGIK